LQTLAGPYDANNDGSGLPLAQSAPRAGALVPVPARIGKRWRAFLRALREHFPGERTMGRFSLGFAGVALAVILTLGLGRDAVMAGYAAAIDELNSMALAMGVPAGKLVIEGATGIPDPDIIAAAGLSDATALPFVSVAAARARLLDVPAVADATVQKLYPDTVSVSLSYRAPFALWQHGGAFSLVDVEGRVLRAIAAPDAVNLPVVVGAGANEAAGKLSPCWPSTRL